MMAKYNKFKAKDCHKKWHNLRVTYLNNLAKEKYMKSGQAPNRKIQWRFFEAMRFLGNNALQATTPSISNLQVSLPLLLFNYHIYFTLY